MPGSLLRLAWRSRAELRLLAVAAFRRRAIGVLPARVYTAAMTTQTQSRREHAVGGIALMPIGISFFAGNDTMGKWLIST